MQYKLLITLFGLCIDMTGTVAGIELSVFCCSKRSTRRLMLMWWMRGGDCLMHVMLCWTTPFLEFAPLCSMGQPPTTAFPYFILLSTFTIVRFTTSQYGFLCILAFQYYAAGRVRGKCAATVLQLYGYNTSHAREAWRCGGSGV